MGCSNAPFNEDEGEQVPLEGGRETGRGERRGRGVLTGDACGGGGGGVRWRAGVSSGIFVTQLCTHEVSAIRQSEIFAD